VLKAYSLLDPDVGYTQGMSFICAIVLMQVEQEELAFCMFVKLLNICNWRDLYLYQTPKLFDLTRVIRNYIAKDMPKLNEILTKNNVILESLFASPFLTLFANLVPMDQSLKIIDRFILCKLLYLNFLCYYLCLFGVRRGEVHH
jgi:hypothetical protein